MAKRIPRGDLLPVPPRPDCASGGECPVCGHFLDTTTARLALIRPKQGNRCRLAWICRLCAANALQGRPNARVLAVQQPLMERDDYRLRDLSDPKDYR